MRKETEKPLNRPQEKLDILVGSDWQSVFYGDEGGLVAINMVTNYD